MSIVTDFRTQSFPLNSLGNAAEDWNLFFPERKVEVVPSHMDASGENFGFAYCPDQSARECFERWVESEIALEEEREEDFPGGELGRAWANASAEEYRKIAEQNREDAEQERQYPPVSYMGVVGRWNPDDGYIFEL